jgi:hypothetical protein
MDAIHFRPVEGAVAAPRRFGGAGANFGRDDDGAAGGDDHRPLSVMELMHGLG